VPSPSGKRSPAKKLILAPVLLGTIISCGICAFLSWKEYMFPEEPPFSFSISWWLQAEHGAGAGLGVMTAVIISLCLLIFNRKRMN
jgi:hypothetical protein